MTDDDAFAALGYALLEEQFGSRRLSYEDALDIGRRWFQSVLPTLRLHICGNKLIEEALLTPAAQARNAAIVAALDAALAKRFNNIPVTTVSHAVICYGIHRLCENPPEPISRKS
jgi:hypothetical protein